MKRRDMLALIGAPALLSLLPGRAAWAAPAGYPSREVNLVVTFAPGGGSDFIARYLGDRLQRDWARPVIVTNVAGAGGRTGTAEAARAAPDGHTLLVGANGPLAIFPHLYPDLPYKPETSFVPISTLTSQPFVIAASKAMPFDDLAGLIAYAKAHPGDLNFGSAGVGTTPHLVMEILSGRAGIEMAHVPYRGSPPALQDLMAGVIELMIGDPNTLMGPVSEGLIKAIAVTSAERSPLYPETPTVAEAGIEGFDFGGWFGLLAPAGTPGEIVEYLSTEVSRTMGTPEAQKTLGALGGRVGGSSPAEFAAWMAQESERWREAIEQYDLAKFLG